MSLRVFLLVLLLAVPSVVLLFVHYSGDLEAEQQKSIFMDDAMGGFATLLEKGHERVVDEFEESGRAYLAMEILHGIAVSKLGTNDTKGAAEIYKQLGAIAFYSSEGPKAIRAYCQSLLLNPDDPKTRRQLIFLIERFGSKRIKK